MTEPRLSNLTPLPGKYLFPKDNNAASEYDKLPDAEKFAKGGKWWSMYDLMQEFHSGIMTEQNDSNFFEFEIDFTSPHLRISTITDPNLSQEVNNTMTSGLQNLATKIQGLISKLQLEANASSQKNILDAMNRPSRGGKKKTNAAVLVVNQRWIQ